MTEVPTVARPLETPAVERRRLEIAGAPVTVRAARFAGAGGVAEWHLSLTPHGGGAFERQFNDLAAAYRGALAELGLAEDTAVLRRFFCSDVVNQASALAVHDLSVAGGGASPCAVSWVGQPPEPPAKLALWAYHIQDPTGPLDKKLQPPALCVDRGELTHHWTTGLTAIDAHTSYEQTWGIFERYDALLATRGMRLADHVMRTWLFVPCIDADYKGLVDARREFFALRGLTPDTHFIASSGIGAAAADVAARVGMDAWAIGGVRDEQIEYLEALDHLSPTHIYGVTFERGTSVCYRDRRHVLLSGTASIDNRGQILHGGDVSRQLDRTVENMEALLRRAGAGLHDLASLIVYLRDPGDFAVVREQLAGVFGETPRALVLAPVCRPGWLIEIEGLALAPADRPELPGF